MFDNSSVCWRCAPGTKLAQNQTNVTVSHRASNTTGLLSSAWPPGKLFGRESKRKVLGASGHLNLEPTKRNAKEEYGKYNEEK